MGIVVENGGVLTTVQDEGRFGYRAYGVSTSGAMDTHAFHIANLLVGNKMTEGALEMTFIGSSQQPVEGPEEQQAKEKIPSAMDQIKSKARQPVADGGRRAADRQVRQGA